MYIVKTLEQRETETWMEFCHRVRAYLAKCSSGHSIDWQPSFSLAYIVRPAQRGELVAYV